MKGYDLFASTYDDMIRKKSAINEACYHFVLNELEGAGRKKICDLGCGQGELSRRLAEAGGVVTGIDFSQKLLDIAQNYPSSVSIDWIHDDAQELKKVPSEQFDIVVSNLVLMDVPDFQKVFQSSYRILKHDGIMIWIIMHPCFQSPHSETLEDGA